MDSGTDWLCEILRSVQLEQFYLPIRDQLQVNFCCTFRCLYVIGVVGMKKLSLLVCFLLANKQYMFTKNENNDF